MGSTADVVAEVESRSEARLRLLALVVERVAALRLDVVVALLHVADLAVGLVARELAAVDDRSDAVVEALDAARLLFVAGHRDEGLALVLGVAAGERLHVASRFGLAAAV